MDFPKFLLEEKVNLPALKTFKARDGEGLSYRFYEGVDSDIVIICLHGSGSHGEYLHHLAKFFSKEIGQVIVPNLRGHFGSGKTAGDCTYIGQLEDDIMDLIRYLNLQGKKIYLLGHSSVGGLAIRLVGSKYRKFFAGTILLAPAIPTTPTMKKKSSWAEVSIFKIVLLSI
ncbi:MAG: alpha/beta fold hydrolase, partial [Gammaproteobacteria bacterium]|nr:alpha/beta fold hydrolase [Gammaproteobacteria bacterium]